MDYEGLAQDMFENWQQRLPDHRRFCQDWSLLPDEYRQAWTEALRVAILKAFGLCAELDRS